MRPLFEKWEFGFDRKILSFLQTVGETFMRELSMIVFFVLWFCMPNKTKQLLQTQKNGKYLYNATRLEYGFYYTTELIDRNNNNNHNGPEVAIAQRSNTIGTQSDYDHEHNRDCFNWSQATGDKEIELSHCDHSTTQTQSSV